MSNCKTTATTTKAPQIRKSSEISVSNMVFTKKAKTIAVQYSVDGGKLEPLYLLSPKLEYSLPVKYQKLRLTVYLSDSTDSTKKTKFGTLFEEIDKFIPELAFKHRKEWFDESLWDSNVNTFRESYKRQIGYDKERKNRLYPL